MLNVYRRSLTWVLDNPGLILVVLVLTIALNVVLVIRVPKGFFPQQDTGVIFGGMQGPQDASFPAMNARSSRQSSMSSRRPGVEQRHRLHRRPGRHQRRLHLHRAQAPRTSAREPMPPTDHQPPAPQARTPPRAHQPSCRPRRTSASAAAPATRTISTPSRPTTSTISPSGARCCSAR